MGDKAEASFAKEYRDARRAFIAACERAHGDSIARVHPRALGPDSKPLFVDSVAFGAREADKALLVITGCHGEAGLLGSHVLTHLLDHRTTPMPGARLVLVHALNPFGFAWQRHENEEGLSLDDPGAATSWSFAMLTAIVTEDLGRIRKLRMLEVDRGREASVTDAQDSGPARILADFRPELDLTAARLTLRKSGATFMARRVVTRALAAL